MNTDFALKEKLDSIGWLSRSCELVSTVLVQDMVNAFKSTVTPSQNDDLRDKYIKKTHGSNAVIVTVKRLQQALQVEDIREERILNKVHLLLTILEPLVINEENAIKATEAGVIT